MEPIWTHDFGILCRGFWLIIVLFIGLCALVLFIPTLGWSVEIYKRWSDRWVDWEYWLMNNTGW